MKNIVIHYALLVCFFSSKNRLLKTDHDLNGWRWPFKLFNKYYYSLITFDNKGLVKTTKYTLTIPIIKYISIQISEYEKLRYHNSDMDDVQFNYWWMLCHGNDNDEDNNLYYKKYPIK